jgi:hypothetical protein
MIYKRYFLLTGEMPEIEAKISKSYVFDSNDEIVLIVKVRALLVSTKETMPIGKLFVL